MRLGEKIYTLRTGKNLSQGDLADALDVSRQSISKWETNASVPELDKLVKLSEIFGITLDELVLDKQPQEAPQPQPVYIEREAPRSTQKVIGTILVCFGALVWLLITLLGDFLAGLIFASPFVLCGLICLFVRKNAGLWCLWAIYLSVDAYLRYATGVSWAFAFNARFYASGWTAQLIVAWCLWFFFAALVAATVLRFRGLPMALSKKNVLLTVICWVLFVISSLPIPIPVTAPEMIWWVNLLLSATDWIKNILFVAALTFTARLITTYRNSRKKAD